MSRRSLGEVGVTKVGMGIVCRESGCGSFTIVVGVFDWM
jgi:hypothetical protein